MTIRVLEVLATLKPAGAERMVLTLSSALNRARFEPFVVSLYDPFDGGLDCDFQSAGVHPMYLGKRPGLDLRIFSRLAGTIRSVQPHIIHTHSYVMRYAVPARWLARSRAREVHTVHNLAAREVDRAGALIHRHAFRRGVVPVAVGAEVARSFEQQYGFAPELIPNGIDLSRYMRPGVRERWRAEHGFATSDLLVISVARLDEQKNPLLLLEAFADAATPRAHLLYVGGGALADRVRASAPERVHLLGARRDVPDILVAADVFALASDWEGYPLAVLEAMAAGLPVCATAVGGVPEAVEHGVSGLLSPAGDASGLAANLRAMLTDEPLRARLGKAAAAASAGFSATTMVGRYESLFERLVQG